MVRQWMFEKSVLLSFAQFGARAGLLGAKRLPTNVGLESAEAKPPDAQSAWAL
jgi:hypothetical protein